MSYSAVWMLAGEATKEDFFHLFALLRLFLFKLTRDLLLGAARGWQHICLGHNTSAMETVGNPMCWGFSR